MRKKVLGIVLATVLVMSLGLVLTLPTSAATDVLLDSVNIGDSTSETLHNIQGWSDVWTCGPYNLANKTGDWCACHDGGTGVGNMRLIWGDGGETCDPENKWASVDLNTGPYFAKTLSLEHLEGAADDGFNIYVNDVLVATDIDEASSNTWLTEDFDISSWNFTGTLTIKFEATADAWSGCGIYGQVAFNMIELYGDTRVVEIDIKPTSCPNPINFKSKGVLPVAILGTGDFDVTTIDPDTVRLEGVAPLRWKTEDVATPYVGEVTADCPGCECCHEEGLDGHADLTLKFSTQEIVAALGYVANGDCLILQLTGSLKEEFDGTPFMGEDVVKIINQIKGCIIVDDWELQFDWAEPFPATYNHGMMIDFQNVYGSFSGAGGYPFGGSYTKTWTVSGELATSGSLSMVIAYDSPSTFEATLIGNLAADCSSMSGTFTGTGPNFPKGTWTATRVP